MNRRSLLKALCLTPVAAFVAPLLPKPKPAVVSDLGFMPWRVNRPYPRAFEVGDTFTIEGMQFLQPIGEYESQQFTITAVIESAS